MNGDLLQFANHGKIVLGQKRMEVLEDEDGGFNLFDDLIQGYQRVFGGWITVFLTLQGGSRRYNTRAVAPLEGLFIPPFCYRGDDVLNPHFLTAANVKNRVTRSDQNFYFFSELHEHGSGETKEALVFISAS